MRPKWEIIVEDDEDRQNYHVGLVLWDEKTQRHYAGKVTWHLLHWGDRVPSCLSYSRADAERGYPHPIKDLVDRLARMGVAAVVPPADGDLPWGLRWLRPSIDELHPTFAVEEEDPHA